MDRLTIRDKNGESHMICKQMCGDYGHQCDGQIDVDMCQRYVAFDKLAEYEDLEEQGLLLKLPCKVGTKVYAFLHSDNHFTECQINKIEIKPTIYGKMCYFIEPTSHRGCLYRYFENDFAKTLFITQGEAEA